MWMVSKCERTINQSISQPFGCLRVIRRHNCDNGAEIAIGLGGKNYRAVHARMFCRT